MKKIAAAEPEVRLPHANYESVVEFRTTGPGGSTTATFAAATSATRTGATTFPTASTAAAHAGFGHLGEFRFVSESIFVGIGTLNDRLHPLGHFVLAELAILVLIEFQETTDHLRCVGS
jgi:hypothetical protein